MTTLFKLENVSKYVTIDNQEQPILKNINLFDVYEGKNLPEGKKSYAMSFELLNEEKTLESSRHENVRREGKQRGSTQLHLQSSDGRLP